MILFLNYRKSSITEKGDSEYIWNKIVKWNFLHFPIFNSLNAAKKLLVCFLINIFIYFVYLRRTKKVKGGCLLTLVEEDLDLVVYKWRQVENKNNSDKFCIFILLEEYVQNRFYLRHFAFSEIDQM